MVEDIYHSEIQILYDIVYHELKHQDHVTSDIINAVSIILCDLTNPSMI